ncbi:SGNH/GDSL hydrolase family protein [Gordonia sp. CPCC 205515]|uniref:SGNH/GDSL hydrolase family protein n=1 Tax=Gordonia sp. CPCC 205515 TaxID=3140791 RepID=UPI003AF40859
MLVAVTIGLVVAMRPAAPTIGAPHTEMSSPRPSQDAIADALFIGDSYTAGNGLSELSPSCVAAVQMHWQCSLSAVPGTGYISGGPANRFTVDPYIGESTSFIERIPGLGLQYRPDVVILDGGRNDSFPKNKLDVFNVMVATIVSARRTWPEAKLVFVRPRYLYDPTSDLGLGDLFIANAIAVADADVTLIDPIARITGDVDELLGPDGEHPNSQGEKVLADALVAEFTSRGLAQAT